MRLAAALRSLAAFAAMFVALCTAPALAQSLPPVSWPPSPPVKLALNPVTNKIYLVDEFASSVTVVNLANNTTKTIGVGARPQYIAVNPNTNRIYVNNTADATLSVIDGVADAVLTTLPLGSIGPIQINPVTNVIYVVRLTGPSTDEVTYVNGDNDTYYTIATQSFQPIAVAVNYVTNMIYAAHYGTGDVRAISGAMTGNDHPATVSIGVWSRPFAIAANPVTNKVYVATEDSRGPVAVIDGATNTAVFPPIASGYGVGPKALAINTVSNKVYAAFKGEVVILDGNTNAITYVSLGSTENGPIEIGVNHATNKVYVATDRGSLMVIDGATNAASMVAIPAGANSLAVNPITNKVHVYGPNSGLASMDGAAGPAAANPITTTITPLANHTSGADVTFTLGASSSFAPTAPSIRKVYYQLDSKAGAWGAASGSGPYTASFTGLTAGTHTLYAFATDGQDAPLHTSSASAPLVGAIAAYTFTVGSAPPPPPEKVTPSVSLSTSANPSIVGNPVTFTVTVSGSAGTATGTVAFRNGGTAVPGCDAVTLSSGTATCTMSGLAQGTHSITAAYAGSTAYNPATSAAIAQVVNAAPPPDKVTPSVSLSTSANPTIVGNPVTFTATVSGSAGTATGTVAFRAGSTTIPGCEAVTLASGAATCTTSGLSQGTHAITAAYAGSTAYNPATSGAISQAVNAAPPPPPPAKVAASVSLATSKNPAEVREAVTFTAVVTGSAGTATGTVAFRAGSTVISGCGAVSLSSGRATCTTTALAQGTHSITAAYGGSSAYLPGTSGAISQVIDKKGNGKPPGKGG